MRLAAALSLSHLVGPGYPTERRKRPTERCERRRHPFGCASRSHGPTGRWAEAPEALVGDFEVGPAVVELTLALAVAGSHVG
jgi:hypothetical protein